MSYEAIVCRLTNVRPHSNADRLQLATVAGHQIVVGLDNVEGQLGVFFPADGVLADAYCKANDLYPRYNADNERIGGGFFDLKRPRVRAQSFRGEKSDGYWAPVASLDYLADTSSLKEGMTFSELNGEKVCEKYMSPATVRALANRAAQQRRENAHFAQHVDTKQLRYEIDSIPADAVIWITEKLHGTSHRQALVLDEVEVPNSRLRRILRRPARTTKTFRPLVGTRRVILKDPEINSGGFYGDDSFRWAAATPLFDNMHEGEILYGELVGYTPSGASIMATHSTSDIKELKKLYGPTMEYKYGAAPGICSLYIYRITRVSNDGHVVELSWPQTKARCAELGIAHVPELAGPFIAGRMAICELALLVADPEDGPSTLDHAHIREGVVVRVNTAETSYLKSKSWAFRVMEGITKNDEAYVDMEEAA